MRRTTVKLPEDLDAKLRAEAERRGMTISELTRDAIETYLSGGRRAFASAGAGRSGSGDIAARAEEIFAEILDEKHREGEL
jgi:hypothetical protein